MPDVSPILALPLIQPAQAQKHVTHNESLRLLDVLVQAAVATRGQDTPPATPADGERHLVGPAPTGLWAGQAGKIAFWEEPSGWAFLAPQEGWSVHVVADDASITFIDGAWVTAAQRPLQASRLGIAAAADDTNRLAVASDSVLFTHAGSGHQIKVNKAAAANTASLLFQTGWSGRAEMGTTGSDDFEIKTSANGSAFQTSLRAAATDGRVTLPSGAAVAPGTAALPGLSLDGDPDTGMLSPGADQIGWATGGTQRLSLSTSALTSTVPVLHPAGSASAPGVTFTGDTNTGMLSPGADQIGWATGGTQRLSLSTSALTSTLPVLHPAGSASAPGVTFTGDTNTGMLWPGADQIGWTTGGTQRLLLSTSALTSTLPVLFPLGSASAPGMAFTSDTNTGIWSPGGDQIAMSTNGVERVRVSNGGFRVGDAPPSGTFGSLQMCASAAGGLATLALTAYDASASSPLLIFNKTRGTTSVAVDLVQAGDNLGQIRFNGADGLDVNNIGADIVSTVTGTPAVDDIRSNIRLRTRGAGGVADRLVVDDVSVAVTGRLSLNAATAWAASVTIADDAVATVTPGRTGGFLMLTANGGVGAAATNEGFSAHIFFDCGSTSPSISKSSGFASIGANVAVVTTDLTGTSGTDGNVTVSARNDGTLKIENRSGSATSFNLWVM